MATRITTRIVESLVMNCLRNAPLQTSFSSLAPPSFRPMKASTAPSSTITAPMIVGKKPGASMKVL